jgi:hypothetical protein
MKRAVTLLALLMATLAWPAPAQAGTYEVVACGGAAGGAQNAFTASADPGMAAYTICPNTPGNVATGVVTRASATAGAGSVPYFAGAYQVFEAPAGASLVSVTFDVAAIRLASYWTTGVVTYDGNFNTGEGPYGCYAGAPGCALGLPAFFGPVTVGLGGHGKFRLETRCVNPGGCDISGSGFIPGMRALFAAANVRVVVQDYSGPAITPFSGALWNGGWHRGHEDAWQLLTDNVGIEKLRLVVDGATRETQDYRDAVSNPAVQCDFTRPRPCSDVTGGLYLDTAALPDGRHSIRVEAVDAAGNVSSREHAIDVDNTPPARVDAALDAGGSWRRSNDFAVRWTEPPGQVSPIAAAHYEICTTSAPQRCTTGAQSAPAIDGLANIRLPADGAYALRVWLEDEAGNASDTTASRPIELRLDSTPPERAEFDLVDERDPRRIEALVSDSASGIDNGSIEMRQSGRRQWHELPTSLSPGRMSAYIDDLALPDGNYEFRTRVTDAAGNERVSERRVDGSKMELMLPLRSRSRIVLRTDRQGRAGRSARGLLESGDGKPLAGLPVLVSEQPRNASSFHQSATLQTDSRGLFSYPLHYGPSRTVRFRYDGTRLIKPSVESLILKVPARTTIRTRRSFLRNGQSAQFRGRLRGLPPPEGGKLIDLQAYYRGSWRTFATPRTDSRGRWSFRYRFEATHGLVRYRFRARIRRETAYPYELGYSRVVTVTVRG